MAKLPSLSSRQLIHLLQTDGWEIARRTKHGVSLTRPIEGRVRVAIVPENRKSLDPEIIGRILGPKQTGLGRRYLENLIAKHGLS